MPKIYLIYFKNLLDIAFTNFFDIYNNSFIYENCVYRLISNFSNNKIKKIFKTTIDSTLMNCVESFDILKPKYYFVIGSCMPKNNLLLTIKNDSYFPEKLNKLINSEYQLKYVLKEKDIKIDLVKFNSICIELFNEYFKKTSKNIIYITHKNLDCYTMFKVLTTLYGKSNCVNLYTEKFNTIKSPLIAINDLIDNYVHNKTDLNSNIKFKNIVSEIKQFTQTKMGVFDENHS